MNINVGDIVRMCGSNGESCAFSDCYVAKKENGVVTLRRPYVLSSDGMTGTEVFTVFETSFEKDAAFWKKVQR